MTFCVLGADCSVYDRHQKLPGVSLYNPLCEGCRNRAVGELNLLRYDYVDLSQLIAKRDGHSEAKISRPKPESSPPLDVSVFTLRSRIAWTVTAAERCLRLWMRDRPVGSAAVREGFALDGAVRYLQPRVDDLARLPAQAGPNDGDEANYGGTELLTAFGMLHRSARKVCGLDPRTMSVPGFCPSCSVPALRRHDDDAERYWCSRCQAQLSKAAYYSAQRMQFAPSPGTP